MGTQQQYLPELKTISRQTLLWQLIVSLAHSESRKGMGVGEGSIRVGATGKISALITHELNTTKDKPKASIPYEKRPQTVPVSVYCGVSTKKQQPKKKKLHKSRHDNTHQVPMVGLDNMYTDRTPIRDTSTKRRHRIVEIVDLKCGTSADKVRYGPKTDQFRKLTFSRLS